MKTYQYTYQHGNTGVSGKVQAESYDKAQREVFGFMRDDSFRTGNRAVDLQLTEIIVYPVTVIKYRVPAWCAVYMIISGMFTGYAIADLFYIYIK